MKNSLTNWKTIAAAAIVIVVTVIAWLAPQPKSADVLSTTPVDLTSQPPATATPAHLAPPSSSIRPTPIVRSVTPAAPAKISPAVPQRPAYVKITASSATDYQSYITQLTNAQNWCKTISENAFNQLYAGSLESASFQYYYNQNSGYCYSRVAGNMRAAYATTTTAVIYFRDSGTGNMVAQCLDNAPTPTFADNEWKCTNDVTAQPLSLPAFNALISQYAVQ